jgi:protein-tyrosine-phosphatase
MPKAFAVAVVLLTLTAGSSVAQDTASAERPRVFITDSQSWEIGGYSAGGAGGGGSMTHGGARPQTAEIIKTFGERCPQVITNNLQQKADYIVLLDHEGGKSFVRHKNKVAVFGRISGDSVVSKSTLSLGGSVQEACEAITKDWAIHSATMREARNQESGPVTAKDPPPQPQMVATPTPVSAVSSAPRPPATGRVSVACVPDGADIEVDGSFVGNTPSNVEIPEGEHTIVVKKAGYKDWERKFRISGGSDVHLSAILDKAGTQ